MTTHKQFHRTCGIRSAAAAALCLLALAAAPQRRAFAAEAAAPAPEAIAATDTIHACYAPKSGTVYRIKAPGAPDKCKIGHNEFSWTEASSPLANIRVLTGVANAQNGFLTLFMTCPVGEMAIAGGHEVTLGDSFARVEPKRIGITSFFDTANIPKSYVYDAEAFSGPSTVRVQVFCVPIP